jgi:hypothetical protein
MKSLLTKVKTILFYFKPRKIVAQYKLFFGDEWLEASVDSIAPYVYKILFVVSDLAWGDEIENKKIEGDNLEPIFLKLKEKYPGKIIVYRGSWNKQVEHVQAGLDFIKQNIQEASHCLYIDGDEVYMPKQIKKLIRLSKNPKYFNSAIRINYNTYFKSIYYRVTPSKGPYSLTLFPLRYYIYYINERNVSAGIKEFPNIYFEHYSYIRINEKKIQEKLKTHIAGNEPILDNWYERVWLNWTTDTKNFHPTNPIFFEAIEIIQDDELPSGIKEAYKIWKKNDQIYIP